MTRSFSGVLGLAIPKRPLASNTKHNDDDVAYDQHSQRNMAESPGHACHQCQGVPVSLYDVPGEDISEAVVTKENKPDP